MTDTVRRISRFSTGTVDIHPQHAHRTHAPMYWWILTSRRWLRARPINVYVVEHRDGLVLFDTGQDRASVTDPHYFPGGATGLIYRRLAQFHVDADDTLTAGLERFGYAARDVTTTVVSHLHQDHIGGVREVSQAPVLVAPDEWRSVQRPLAGPRGLLRAHIDVPGVLWEPIEFEPLDDGRLAPFTVGRDLFGDGTVVVLPTPGHTAGSISMFVRPPDRPPVLLVGDLTYDAHAYERGGLGGVGSARRQRATRRRVLELRDRNPGLEFLAAHDPSAEQRLETSRRGALLST